MTELYGLVATAAGSDLAPRPAPARPGELQRSALDPRRAGLHLGWKPWTPLAEGIAAVVELRPPLPVRDRGPLRRGRRRQDARRAAGRRRSGRASSAIVNTGDDTELHGSYISPDLDTITYTLAGAVNPATGWGLAGETFRAMEALERYGGITWFRLGDADLATHLYRTGPDASRARRCRRSPQRSRRAWGLGVRLCR